MAAKWPAGAWLSVLINACTALVKMTQDEISVGTPSEKIAAMESIQGMYEGEALLQGWECTSSISQTYEWEVSLVPVNRQDPDAVNQDYIDVFNGLLDYEDDNEDLLYVAILQDSQDPTQLSVG